MAEREGRPAFNLDLRSKSHGPLGNGSFMLSPLLASGAVAQELSPLDAFAAQSRMLAKQLEEERSKNGRRISRLPPLRIEDSFNHNRPGFLRSVSADDHIPDPESPPTTSAAGAGIKTEIEAAPFRPISVYPLVGNARSPTPTKSPPRIDRGRQPARLFQGFDSRIHQSPSPMGRETINSKQTESPSRFPTGLSVEAIRPWDSSSASTSELSGLRGYDVRGLAPPRSPFAQKPASLHSGSVDDSDDEIRTALRASDTRTFSTSSAFSNSPISPPFTHGIRSSISSDRLSRPTFNFSRPLSRASDLPFDPPSRQASSDSQPFVLADDTVHTPVSMHSEEFNDSSQTSAPGPSYVYSRFALPRGKMLQRNPAALQDQVSSGENRWEQPSLPRSNNRSNTVITPPSPPSRPSTSSLGQRSLTSEPAQSIMERQSAEEYRGRQPQVRNFSAQTESSSLSLRSGPTPSIASGSTIKASSLAPSAALSAEEHVTKGIDCHERGSLNESTYHLRIAARQNHPTGMLLYALACRHGWGMRPNQKEGVEWLRKAAECAMSEVSDGKDSTRLPSQADSLEQKSRKAQFALSIYELGVSHMNGWGIDQDKVLALRCFEIAGTWGDGDALAEAGFCYAQGIGCKKDLKKSARFYRQAEEKGISMVGNSWIYKNKYMDKVDSKPATESPEKKARSKSRSRSMFGRMKSSS